MAERRTHAHQRRYSVRLMASLVAVLLLAISAVRLWPARPEEAPALPFDTRPSTAIQVNEVQPTRQSAPAPPPPPLLPPVEVPNDVVFEPVPLDFSADFLTADAPSDGTPGPEGPPEDASASRVPDTAPRQIKLVEPTYSRAAQRAGVQARIVVEVLVRSDGTVGEARILERIRLDGGERAVSHLGHGLEASALSAARQTTFFPARAGGEAVESRTTITIRFGQ